MRHVSGFGVCSRRLSVVVSRLCALSATLPQQEAGHVVGMMFRQAVPSHFSVTEVNVAAEVSNCGAERCSELKRLFRACWRQLILEAGCSGHNMKFCSEVCGLPRSANEKGRSIGAAFGTDGGDVHSAATSMSGPLRNRCGSVPDGRLRSSRGQPNGRARSGRHGAGFPTCCRVRRHPAGAA